MLRFRAAFRKSLALACALAFTLAVSSAAAKPKVKRTTIPDHFAAEAEPVEKPFATPVRFFTIKQVLARIDAGQMPAKGRSLGRSLGARGSDVTQFASLGDRATQSDAPALRGALPPRGDEPFGLFAFRAPEGILWRKWRGLEADLAREAAVAARCGDGDGESECPPAARRFLKIVEAVKAREGRARIEEANRNINAVIRYITDYAQHGEPDLWTAPLATLAAGRGDCEDYAIAKYVVLREAGFPAADLRLVLVRDRAVRQDHAVLAARHDGRWLVLDNRHSALAEDMDLRHFTPLFALDQDGVKLFAAPYAKRPAGDGESVVAPIPAAWLEGDEFALRGTLAAEPLGFMGGIDAPRGSTGLSDAPLLM